MGAAAAATQPGFLDGFFWWMIALGGVGGFIDFLLGKPGQRKIRDWLERRWYAFEDVKWRNFGRTEAETVVSIVDRVAGRSLWTWRRWIVAFIIAITAFVFGCVCAVYAYWHLSSGSGWSLNYTYALASLPVVTVASALSISVTRAISRLVLRLPERPSVMVAGFGALLLVHLLLLAVWTPIVGTARTLVGDVISADSPLMLRLDSVGFNRIGDLVEVTFEFSGRPPPDTTRGLFVGSSFVFNPAHPFATLADRFTVAAFRGGPANPNLQLVVRSGADLAADMILNLSRILFAAVFLFLLAFRPLLRQLTSVIWARIVESDKPLATMVLGGIATGSKAIQEAIKHLS